MKGGRKKRTGVTLNIKPTKSLESSISGLSVSLDNCGLVVYILGHRPQSQSDRVYPSYANLGQFKGFPLG